MVELWAMAVDERHEISFSIPQRRCHGNQVVADCIHGIIMSRSLSKTALDRHIVAMEG